jgi:hypothetical protein
LKVPTIFLPRRDCQEIAGKPELEIKRNPRARDAKLMTKSKGVWRHFAKKMTVIAWRRQPDVPAQGLTRSDRWQQDCV